MNLRTVACTAAVLTAASAWPSLKVVTALSRGTSICLVRHSAAVCARCPHRSRRSTRITDGTSFSLSNFEFSILPFYLQDHAESIIRGDNTLAPIGTRCSRGPSRFP
jgi:hypothetical protein